MYICNTERLTNNNYIGLPSTIDPTKKCKRVIPDGSGSLDGLTLIFLEINLNKNIVMTEKNTKNLKALKEGLKKKMNEFAVANTNFEKDVNEITFKKGGCGRIETTADFLVDRLVGDYCDKIIESRMSQRDKEYLLNTLMSIIGLTEQGQFLISLSKEDYEEAVKTNATVFLKKNEKLSKNLSTGGTTETHKTEVVNEEYSI